MKEQILLLSLLLCTVSSCIPAQYQQTSIGKTLATIPEGTSKKTVERLLGLPDEIRYVPDDNDLDGLRVHATFGPDTELGEVSRWVYGVGAKGTFAREGIVSFDKNQNVVLAQHPIHGMAHWNTDYDFDAHIVSKTTGLRCHLGQVSTQKPGRYYEARVTITNSQASEFTLKRDIVDIHAILVSEVYDTTKHLIFRHYHSSIYSPRHYSEEDWPVLRIPPGQTVSDDVAIVPGSYFGALPPGQYYWRVYFPVDQGKYLPSNLAPFEVPDTPGGKQ